MLIENANPSEWQFGDIIDVKGIQFENGSFGVAEQNLAILQNWGGKLTFHRKSEIEKIKDQIAILQAELEALEAAAGKEAKSTQPNQHTGVLGVFDWHQNNGGATTSLEASFITSVFDWHQNNGGAT